jgi:hypothetical protein
MVTHQPTGINCPYTETFFGCSHLASDVSSVTEIGDDPEKGFSSMQSGTLGFFSSKRSEIQEKIQLCTLANDFRSRRDLHGPAISPVCADESKYEHFTASLNVYRDPKSDDNETPLIRYRTALGCCPSVCIGLGFPGDMCSHTDDPLTDRCAPYEAGMYSTVVTVSALPSYPSSEDPTKEEIASAYIAASLNLPAYELLPADAHQHVVGHVNMHTDPICPDGFAYPPQEISSWYHCHSSATCSEVTAGTSTYTRETVIACGRFALLNTLNSRMVTNNLAFNSTGYHSSVEVASLLESSTRYSAYPGYPGEISIPVYEAPESSSELGVPIPLIVGGIGAIGGIITGGIGWGKAQKAMNIANEALDAVSQLAGVVQDLADVVSDGFKDLNDELNVVKDGVSNLFAQAQLEISDLTQKVEENEVVTDATARTLASALDAISNTLGSRINTLFSNFIDQALREFVENEGCTYTDWVCRTAYNGFVEANDLPEPYTWGMGSNDYESAMFALRKSLFGGKNHWGNDELIMMIEVPKCESDMITPYLVSHTVQGLMTQGADVKTNTDPVAFFTSPAPSRSKPIGTCYEVPVPGSHSVFIPSSTVIALSRSMSPGSVIELPDYGGVQVPHMAQCVEIVAQIQISAMEIAVGADGDDRTNIVSEDSNFATNGVVHALYSASSTASYGVPATSPVIQVTEPWPCFYEVRFHMISDLVVCGTVQDYSSTGSTYCLVSPGEELFATSSFSGPISLRCSSTEATQSAYWSSVPLELANIRDRGFHFDFDSTLPSSDWFKVPSNYKGGIQTDIGLVRGNITDLIGELDKVRDEAQEVIDKVDDVDSSGGCSLFNMSPCSTGYAWGYGLLLIFLIIVAVWMLYKFLTMAFSGPKSRGYQQGGANGLFALSALAAIMSSGVSASVCDGTGRGLDPASSGWFLSASKVDPASASEFFSTHSKCCIFSDCTTFIQLDSPGEPCNCSTSSITSISSSSPTSTISTTYLVQSADMQSIRSAVDTLTSTITSITEGTTQPPDESLEPFEMFLMFSLILIICLLIWITYKVKPEKVEVITPISQFTSNPHEEPVYLEPHHFNGRRHPKGSNHVLAAATIACLVGIASGAIIPDNKQVGGFEKLNTVLDEDNAGPGVTVPSEDTFNHRIGDVLRTELNSKLIEFFGMGTHTFMEHAESLEIFDPGFEKKACQGYYTYPDFRQVFLSAPGDNAHRLSVAMNSLHLAARGCLGPAIIDQCLRRFDNCNQVKARLKISCDVSLLEHDIIPQSAIPDYLQSELAKDASLFTFSKRSVWKGDNKSPTDHCCINLAPCNLYDWEGCSNSDEVFYAFVTVAMLMLPLLLIDRIWCMCKLTVTGTIGKRAGVMRDTIRASIDDRNPTAPTYTITGMVPGRNITGQLSSVLNITGSVDYHVIAIDRKLYLDNEAELRRFVPANDILKADPSLSNYVFVKMEDHWSVMGGGLGTSKSYDRAKDNIKCARKFVGNKVWDALNPAFRNSRRMPRYRTGILGLALLGMVQSCSANIWSKGCTVGDFESTCCSKSDVASFTTFWSWYFWIFVYSSITLMIWFMKMPRGNYRSRLYGWVVALMMASSADALKVGPGEDKDHNPSAMHLALEFQDDSQCDILNFSGCSHTHRFFYSIAIIFVIVTFFLFLRMAWMMWWACGCMGRRFRKQAKRDEDNETIVSSLAAVENLKSAGYSR